MDRHEARPIVYTALSRHLFYCRMLICKYVLEAGYVPLNPFNVWGYFLYELTDRDLVRRGNNNIVRVSDETWVFGPVADGVLAEIEYAMKLGKPLRFFSAGSKFEDIAPISLEALTFEPEALDNEPKDAVVKRIAKYLERITQG